jgi:large subunit ribosomal protein L7/L12
MRKEEKAQAIAELRQKFARARVAVLTECTGLEGNEVTELRRQLRGAGAELKVVKNTLAVLAADGTPLSVAKDHFRGPLSVAIGYDDPALPAKVLRDFIAKEKRDKKMRITVGVVEGNLLNAGEGRRGPAAEKRSSLSVVGGIAGTAGRVGGDDERDRGQICGNLDSH